MTFSIDKAGGLQLRFSVKNPVSLSKNWVFRRETRFSIEKPGFSIYWTLSLPYIFFSTSSLNNGNGCLIPVKSTVLQKVKSLL